MPDRRAYKIVDQKGFLECLDKRKKRLGFKYWADVARHCDILPNTFFNLRLGRVNLSVDVLEKLLKLEKTESKRCDFRKELLSYTKYGCLYARSFNKKKHIETYGAKHIAEENESHHTKDMGEFGVEALAAAVCLQACVDYRKAIEKGDEHIAQECRVFFGSPMFRYCTGEKSVENAEKKIMAFKTGKILCNVHYVGSRRKNNAYYRGSNG